MTDPTAPVPYHDPFDDNQGNEDILMFDENPTLSLAEFSTLTVTEPNPIHPSTNPPQYAQEITDTNHPYGDPFLWNVLNDHTDTSEMRDETTNQHQQQEGAQTQNFGFGNPMQFTIWPVPPVPYSCSCCQVLREIIHTDGIHVTKLEIHGRLGIFCHAVLEIRSGINWDTQSPQYQIYDFCDKSIKSVKQFLVKYCQERKRNGYDMVQDPLSVFYEALCAGLNNDGNVDTNDFFQPFPPDSGANQTNQPQATPEPRAMNQSQAMPQPGAMNQPEAMPQPRAMNQPEAEKDDGLRHHRRTLAAQRERARNLQLHHLKEYLRLPMDEVAKRVNICSTVLKRTCRRGGLSRWPSRKIKSLEKKIAAKIRRLNFVDMEERERVKAEIESFQRELADIFASIKDDSE